MLFNVNMLDKRSQAGAFAALFLKIFLCTFFRYTETLTWPETSFEITVIETL